MSGNEKEVLKRANINEKKAVRTPCKLNADFSVKNRACISIITNISPLGAFVKSLDIFQIGETVRMVIKAKNGRIRHTGIIIGSNQIGFGLRFANT